MKDEKLENLAHQIMEASGIEDLYLTTDKYYHRIKRKGSSDGLCVNLTYTPDGRAMVVNFRQGGQVYGKLNDAIRGLVAERGLRCLSLPKRAHTVYFFYDEQFLKHERQGGRKGKLDKISFFEAECLIMGLDPETTTSHILGCIKYGVNPETTSEFDLECMKYDLDPKKTSKSKLNYAKYGFRNPGNISRKRLALSMRKRSPVLPELERIRRDKGEVIEGDRIAAARKHFLNCDIDAGAVRLVNYFYEEFPDNYRDMIQWHFGLAKAVREENYERAAELRDQIREIVPVKVRGALK